MVRMLRLLQNFVYAQCVLPFDNTVQLVDLIWNQLDGSTTELTFKRINRHRVYITYDL